MLSSGIILVDKDPGWTSNDVVAKLRGVLGARKVGHCGTLDPMATGLLVVCLNSATKLAEALSRHDKTYLASILFGRQTDTDDSEGRTLGEADASNLTLSDVETTLQSFVGRRAQIPPSYSAVKVDGVRSYKRARQGETFELNPREVVFNRLQVLSWQPPQVMVSVRCSAGTYVRALARDLGNDLGVGAHLSSLRRTESGQFSVDRARQVGEISELCEEGRGDTVVINCLDALSDRPRLVLQPVIFTRLANGQEVDIDVPIEDTDGGYCVVIQEPTSDRVVLARIVGPRRLAPEKLITGNPVPAGL